MPALPSGSGGTGNVDPEFVNQRRRKLAVFLNRLMDGEEFGETESLTLFLTAPDLELSIRELEETRRNDIKEEDEACAKKLADEFAQKKKSSGGTESSAGWSRYTTEAKPVEKSSSWFGRLSSSIQSIGTAKRAPAYVPTSDDEMMSKMLLTVNTLEAKAIVTHRASDALTGARIDACRQTVEWANRLVTPPLEGEVSGEDPAQPAPYKGICEGISGQMAYFGEGSQRTKATTAQQENAVMIKALSDRIEVSLVPPSPALLFTYYDVSLLDRR